MKLIDNYVVSVPTSIREAVKKMDVLGLNSLLITEFERVIGVFTIGDFRRSVLDGIDINGDISLLVNKEFKFLFEGYSQTEVEDLFRDNEFIVDLPVLNSEFVLLDIINRTDGGTEIELDEIKRKMSRVPVVIMAGGKGTRMEPFTRILPKPLIPIGDDPVIKVIMDEFKKCGMENFYISINHKGQMIKAYFHDHALPYKLSYIEESVPLGTAGALLYLDNKFTTAFFVTNCDIIIHANYTDVLDFHTKGKYDLTIIGSMQHYLVPYGVCDVNSNGDLKSIKEKPEFNFLVNTGMYVLEPKILNLIPRDTVFDMPDLINKLQEKSMNVGVFPVSEKSWVDVGQWTEYKKALKELKIKLY